MVLKEFTIVLKESTIVVATLPSMTLASGVRFLGLGSQSVQNEPSDVNSDRFWD